MKKLIVGVLAAALAVGAFTAKADFPLSVSGTVKYSTTSSSEYSGSYASKSFNEKDIYGLITNAMVNLNGFTNIAISNFPAGLPADGYIAFNPTGSDGGSNTASGFFYVTNKTGFYYPLSGLDTNGTYYSFIEFDTFVPYFNTPIDYFSTNDVEFGYDYPFDGAASYKLNSSTGTGTSTTVSTGLLYIHDYPYATDDADNPDIVFEGNGIDYNENVIEIRGILTLNLKVTDYNISSGSGTLTGTGNFFLDDYEYLGVVSSGTARF